MVSSLKYKEAKLEKMEIFDWDLKNTLMIYILAYTYVLTGLFFFLTWRAGYSFLRYILKKENFNLLVGIEIFFLGLNILFIGFVTGYQLFLFLLVILHFINLVFYISGKDSLYDFFESSIHDENIDQFEMITPIMNIAIGIVIIFTNL